MNTVQIFKHPELGEIRVLEMNGEPWFVGKDVAAALGYGNPRDALAKYVDEEDKSASKIPTPSGAQKMTVISEDGLQNLIFSCRRPCAKTFNKWVMNDIMPSLPILREHNSPVKNDDNTSKSLVNALDMDENRFHIPELVPIEREGVRVLLTSQLAEAYETTERRISENFSRHSDRYIMGKHYFLLEGNDLQEFKITTTQFADQFKYAPKIYLWTERGALLHAKSLNTDKAWEVYDYLVETYFRMRETPQYDVGALSPELQLAKTLLESLMRTEMEQKRQAAEQERIAQEQTRQAEEQERMAQEQERQAAEQKRQAQEQKQHMEALKTVDQKLEDIRDVVVTRLETWRKDCLHLVSAIAQKRGGDSKAYQDTNVEIFNLVDQRAHVSLQTRLTNRLNRMKAEGVGKSKRKKLNKIDIIAEDNKLIEIYIAIIKEMCVKYEVSPSVLEEAQSA